MCVRRTLYNPFYTFSCTHIIIGNFVLCVTDLPAGRKKRSIGDSQLCCLCFDGMAEEDTTMCLLDEGDHRSH